MKKPWMQFILIGASLLSTGCDSVMDEYHDAFMCAKIAYRLGKTEQVDGSMEYIRQFILQVDDSERRDLLVSGLGVKFTDELDGILAGYNHRAAVQYMIEKFESSACQDVYDGKY